MKEIIAIAIAVMGILAGIYVGGWLMFIQPIIKAAGAFDAGTLTGIMIAVTFLKCVFAGVTGVLIAVIGFWIAGIINILGGNKK